MLQHRLFYLRNGLPVLFVLVSLPVLLSFRYPFNSHAWDVVLEFCCMAVGTLGLTIRFSTVGYTPNLSDKSNDRLETKGMYSVVRHPLCLGNYFLWLAPVLFLHSAWLCVLYTLTFVLYHRNALLREEAVLREKHGVKFDAWAEQTSICLPNIFRWRKPETGFSWRTAVRSEYYRLFGLVAVMAGLEHIGDYVIEGTFVFNTAWTSIFICSTGMYLFVYSLLGVSAMAVLALLILIASPKKAKAQYFDEPTFATNTAETHCREPIFRLDPMESFSVKESRSLSNLFRQSLPDFSIANPMPTFSNEYFSPEVVAQRPARLGASYNIVVNIASNTRKRVFTDFGNMYTRDNALNFGTVVFGTGMLANSHADRNFQRWYHKRTQCWTTDKFSEFSKVFGEGKYFIPITVTTAFAYRYWQERTENFERRRCGDFFGRTARAYAVGAPTLLIGQYVLGGNRPRHGSSYWKPFQENHGISGHAFLGATPFITAAHMTDNYWAKSVFYTLSILPAWSRVNDDAHYLSQALLGWYLSYMSVRAVSETEGLKPLPKGLTLFPVIENNGAVGLGLLYKR